MARTAVELPLFADRGHDLPLSGQIAGQLRSRIAGGRLDAGERLPASRILAASLGVSRTVVTAAYAQLYAEGWLEGRHGSGTFVAAGAAASAPAPSAPASASARSAPASAPARSAPASASARSAPAVSASARSAPASASARSAPAASALAGSAPSRSAPPRPGSARPGPGRSAPAGPAPGGLQPASGSGNAAPGGRAARPGLAAPVIELRAGIPWTPGIDRAAWRRAWRQAGNVPPSAWPDPLGLPALRHALAAHLRRTRGMHCAPGQILVTRGVTNGLGLLATALLRPGDRVGVEEPGYPAARAVFAAHGAHVVPCRADEHGLVTGELPAGLRLVYTTPAHQYPLGGRLPVPRRQSLIAWARATAALIVEDDYDSEFRYDVAPLPALFGLDPDVVVHLGTTAKTLTPAMGVGWLAARDDLAGLITAARRDISDRTSEAAQHALLALLRDGDLDRHVRRMRREYARRRAAIVAALGDLAGPARLLGDTAGLHVVLELPAGTAAEVAAAAARRGVEVTTMERYFAGPPAMDGLMLGYGGTSLSQVSRGCQIIRQVVAALLAARPPGPGRPRGSAGPAGQHPAVSRAAGPARG